MITRREFLTHTAQGLALAPALGAVRCPGVAPGEDTEITREVLWHGRDGDAIWFHPRPCTLTAGPRPAVLMTMQSISGSDFYGPVYWTRSDDLGRSWREPELIEGLGRRSVDGGMEEGICDVVPQHHAPTDCVLAIGHNVYYEGGRLTQPYGNRFPVYVVGDGKGSWSQRRKLEWDHADTSGIYTCGCGERLVLDNGDVLIPISHGPIERKDRGVTTLRCSFDGETLSVLESGGELRLAAGRGLLEPSLVHFDGRYAMTIRAEDGHGYVASSTDGLDWQPARAWRWDDGEALTMSTTQQHWLIQGGTLHLVYTRKDATNGKVMRYRAPLYMAAVRTEDMTLLRSSERIVLPLVGDPLGAPKEVARMGNFHTMALTDREAWVTVGEARPTAGYRGDLLLARIRST